jgi:hypothetical protein
MSSTVWFRALVNIDPIYICFVTHLICASLAKIKAAKSQICIIDRANINIRGNTIVLAHTLIPSSGETLAH